MMIAAVCCLGILTIACLILGNGILQKKSDKLVELKLENSVLEEQQAAVIKANKDIEKYKELESLAKRIVPQDKDQARTVREIAAIAAQTGVFIDSIDFPKSDLGKPLAGAPVQNKDAAGAAATPTAPTTPPITQTKPVEGLPGLYQLEIKIEVNRDVSYQRLIDFLSRLEQNRRTAQVTSITIHPQDKTPTLTFEITFNIFVKP